MALMGPYLCLMQTKKKRKHEHNGKEGHAIQVLGESTLW